MLDFYALCIYPVVESDLLKLASGVENGYFTTNDEVAGSSPVRVNTL